MRVVRVTGDLRRGAQTRKHVAMIFNCLTRNNLAGFVDGFLLAEKHRPLLNHLIRGQVLDA